jgi:hypothetical protein
MACTVVGRKEERREEQRRRVRLKSLLLLLDQDIGFCVFACTCSVSVCV